MGPVLASNRSFAVVISLLALCFGALAGFGCKDELDLTTTEGIKKALTTKEKLSDAMTEVKGIASDPEKLKVYGSELNQLFLAGSEFDYEVMSYLTKIASPDYKDSYIKAIESGDPRLV
ncbi:MAG: hypothetical protein RBU37_25175, partial [Myxococcota bacterium]|nr:hypothetical protein [Myxococcota bacterium]